MPGDKGRVPDKSNAKTVFIVHGHDDAVRETVARFVTKLDLVPIVLHEQANEGRTIVDKLETHGNVGFAIILLTPDDIGGPNAGSLRPRARQNVVLELGYFWADYREIGFVPSIKVPIWSYPPTTWE